MAALETSTHLPVCECEDQTIMSTTPETTPATTSGWIVMMPDGHPSMWYQHGFKGCTSSAAALGLFQPDQAKRDVLTHAGWSARPGAATELVALAQAERIPA